MNNRVEVTGLQLDHPGFRLGPLAFGTAAGGRLAVVGPSGSGKTTLLRCLAGLERPSAGSIRIGDDLVLGGPRPLPAERRGVGFVFQDGALWSHMTAVEHLRFAAPQLDRAAAVALLERGGLGHLAARKPGSMSGGEAQRLGLLRALAGDPRVLLLDEPLRSVDVHQRDALVLLLRALADERQLTTILVTHDRDEALALATDLVVLQAGRAVEHGAAAELLAAPRTAFTAAFLGGAACLPVATGSNGCVDSAFGEFARPAGAAAATDAHLRLVLLPGDVAAEAAIERDAASAAAPTGTVLSIVPGPQGLSARIAFGDQIVPAIARSPLPVGARARLSLLRPARLLPWDDRPAGDQRGGS